MNIDAASQKSREHKPAVYLAGAIENAPNEGKAWREKLTPFLEDIIGHQVFNPCVEENHLLTAEEFLEFRNWKVSDLPRFRRTMRKIIDTDLGALAGKTDYLVCLWDEHALKGAGTHGELTLAYYLNLPVYMVSTVPREEMSSWIVGCTTELFSHFEDLRAYLLEHSAL
ncbi:MAG: hypothetical protein ACRBF0_17655 [Calditrichia bacterium]